jgi:hypothetical protein
MNQMIQFEHKNKDLISRLNKDANWYYHQWAALKDGHFLMKELLDMALRCLLSSTSPSAISSLLYPWSPKIRSARLKSFAIIRLTDNLKTDPLYASHVEKLFRIWNHKVNSTSLSVWLATGFQLLEQNSQLKKVGPERIAAGVNLEMPNWVYAQQSFQRIKEIIARVTPTVSVYVHGSYAIGDPVPGYSDLDALCVIPKCICLDPKSLLQTRRLYFRLVPLLYSFDRQQHHEFFIFSGWESEYRNPVYYPDMLWQEARYLSGPNEAIKSQTLEEPATLAATFSYAAMILRELEQPDLSNWYFTKKLLSHLALLPTLVKQAFSSPIGKADALQELRSNLQLNSIAQRLRVIRKQWGENGSLPSKSYRNLLSINPQLTRVLIGLREKTPSWVKEILGENFAGEASRFVYSLVNPLMEKAESRHDKK